MLLSKQTVITLVGSVVMPLFISTAHAEIEISESLEGLTAAEKAWLLDDSNLDAYAVSSETLKHSSKANKKDYWLQNRLFINSQSLNKGWINFSQCHNQLDPVPKIEVAYHPTNIRNLQVISFDNIEDVEVLEHSVELINVERGGKVCINGESKTLKIEKDGFSLSRGPYMRKFLDGYYPMIVEETIEIETIKTQLIEQSPQLIENQYNLTNNKVSESSLSMTKIDNTQNNKKRYEFNYAFEGQLKPKYRFTVQ